MTDVHSKKVRSYNMSQIKSKNTKPELVLRKALFARGFRFRIHDKTLPGKPDMVLKKYNTIIFVHGCFWHGHKKCKYFVAPKTRTLWWLDKISGNKNNDSIKIKILKDIGWNVIEIFECDLKKQKVTSTVEKVVETLRKQIE